MRALKFTFNGLGILFIFIAKIFSIKYLYLFVFLLQTEKHKLSLCFRRNKIADSQYRKKITIWELEKNKFT
jgi:hypothetical protein